MFVVVLGYLGALGIVGFSLRSVWRALRHGQLHDRAAFALLAGANLALTAYALALGDPVFVLANGVSCVANLLIVLRAGRRD